MINLQYNARSYCGVTISILWRHVSYGDTRKHGSAFYAIYLTTELLILVQIIWMLFEKQYACIC